MSLFSRFLTDHIELFGQMDGLEANLKKTAIQMASVLRQGGQLFFCGNGGSAADAQHFAAELVGRFVDDRRPLKAIALTTDTSALTCIGNDYGYENIFSRQLEGLANHGDILVLITSSGNSRNLLVAAEAAKRLAVRSIGLMGKGGGKLADLVETALIVPSNDTARIQEAHIFLVHSLCAMIELDLGVGNWTN